MHRLTRRIVQAVQTRQELELCLIPLKTSLKLNLQVGFVETKCAAIMTFHSATTVELKKFTCQTHKSVRIPPSSVGPRNAPSNRRRRRRVTARCQNLQQNELDFSRKITRPESSSRKSRMDEFCGATLRGCAPSEFSNSVASDMCSRRFPDLDMESQVPRPSSGILVTYVLRENVQGSSSFSRENAGEMKKKEKNEEVWTKKVA